MTDKYKFTYVGQREDGDVASWLLAWGAEGIGFGEFYVRFRKNGSIEIDDEFMGKDFIKAALCALVDAARLKSEPETGSGEST